MPEATQYTLDTASKLWKANDEAHTAEAGERNAAIERHWRYYNGNHDLPLKAQKDGYNDNVIVNHVEALADRLTAFMVGDGIRFDVGGDDDAQNDTNLAEIWQANSGETLLETFALAGELEGHIAARVEPGPLAPKVTRIKGKHFAAFWNPFDVQDVLWYRLQHVTNAGGRRIDYVKGRREGDSYDIDHAADGWLEVSYKTDGKSKKTPFGSQTEWQLNTVQPLDVCPVVDWQNIVNPNGYYGKPGITGAIKLNDALNFILSNMQRIIKHHASPKTVGLGFNAGELIGTEVGGFFTVNKPRGEIDVFNLEMQSDLQSSMRLSEIITAGLWQSGGMVDPQTMKDRIGQLTNFGLRVLFSDAIKRTDKKRNLYAEGLQKINDRIFMLLGQAPQPVQVVWPDVLPEDDQLVASVLLQELERKVISVQTYRHLRGYDDMQETERILEEAQTGGNVGASILGLLSQNTAFNRGQ